MPLYTKVKKRIQPSESMESVRIKSEVNLLTNRSAQRIKPLQVGKFFISNSFNLQLTIHGDVQGEIGVRSDPFLPNLIIFS